jgi:hypothetical protein
MITRPYGATRAALLAPRRVFGCLRAVCHVANAQY